jgi:hypothetical protein
VRVSLFDVITLIDTQPSSDSETVLPALLPCSLLFGSTMASFLPLLSLLNRSLPGVPSDSVNL